MKVLQFVISLLLGLCSAGMLFGAMTAASVMQCMGIVLTAGVFVGCIVIIILSWKEMRKDD